MSKLSMVFLAAWAAAGMVLLVRAGASPSLRAAIRTTLVLGLAWGLAYFKERPVSMAALSWRVWAMLALSILAIGVAWWLHCFKPEPVESLGAARADRINVCIAAAIALLLLLGPLGGRYGVAALMVVAGTAILAWNRR